jgi:hypothetical protein
VRSRLSFTATDGIDWDAVSRKNVKLSRKIVKTISMPCEVCFCFGFPSQETLIDRIAAMTAAQARLADTIEGFYGSADKASEGAMAGHAYKRSVDDLDGVVGRELVSATVHSY